MTGVLRGQLDSVQMLLVQETFAVFDRQGVWPVWAYLDHVLDAKGLVAADVLASLPALDDNRPCAGIHDRDMKRRHDRVYRPGPRGSCRRARDRRRQARRTRMRPRQAPGCSPGRSRDSCEERNREDRDSDMGRNSSHARPAVLNIRNSARTRHKSSNPV